MREIIASQTGLSTIDLLDKPPSTDLDVEEPKADGELEEATSLIGAVPGELFKCLSAEQIDRIAKASSFVEFEEGAVVSEQGQPVTHVYICVEGEIETEIKPGLNGQDAEEITDALLKRTYNRGQWWPPEVVIDTPYLTTTRCNARVRVCRIPVEFFRGFVLPASLMARQLVFSEIYHSAALQSIPRFARVLLAIECMQKKAAVDESILHPDARAAVLLIDGAAGTPSGDQFKPGDLIGKIFDDNSSGPIHGAPQCTGYVAARADLTRVLVDPVSPDSRSRLTSLA